MHNKKVFVKDMTKREYFAAQAMTGDLASHGDGVVDSQLAAQLAESWVNCADALIRELEKSNDERMTDLEMREQMFQKNQNHRVMTSDEVCTNGLKQEEMG